VVGRLLGVGGFAEVVQARDESLDADVALKILARSHALNAEIRERFVREARLLRRVRHPAVVTVHDVGETDDGRPFLVMDLAEGGVLSDRLRGAALPADPAGLRAVVRTLAEGLGALHAAGVIHRDIKPANLLVMRDAPSAAASRQGCPRPLLEDGEYLVIGDLGLAKDQLASSYGPTMVGGTPRYQAPEQVEVGASVDARTDVYAATALLWLLVTGEVPPRADELPVKLLGVPPAWRAVLAQGLAADPGARFASMGGWARAVLDTVADASGGDHTQPAARPATATPTVVLPYKGLAAFQPDDAPLFFGRGELVDQLVSRIQGRAVLVVGGPSGCGKSSLVRAGLLPALRGGALPGSAQWQVSVFTPGARPLSALAGHLAGAGVTGLPPGDVLRRDPESIRHHVSPTVLVVIDQFEELFTVCTDPAERGAFLRALAALARGAPSPARVALVVRADFYGVCAAHPWLAEAINDNHVLVGPMSPTQLREAITGPARRVGLHLQEGLVDRVLVDGGGDAGALPLVAHALVETWLRRDGDVLTVAGYEAAGGVAGAIGHTGDHVWDQLAGDERRCARRLLLRLVRPGDGGPDTKRVLSWAEVGDDVTTRRVLDRFANSRLLTVGDQGVELAHEALLRTWARLARWVDESRDELRAGARIEDSAREWERQGRHPDLLYRGLPLATALEWQARQEGAVGEPAGAFLAAATTARDAEHAAAAARTRRAARRRRRAVVALSSLTVLAVVTSAVAGAALLRSRQATRAARAANALASEQLARGLAAAAVDLSSANPYLATVLAAEATARVVPPLAEARRALVVSRLALAGRTLAPYGDPVPVGDAVALAVSPHGDRAATGKRDGMVAVWDLAQREQVATYAGPGRGVQGLAFTADGRWLVAAGLDRRLWRWPADGRSDSTGTVLAEPGAIVWSVAAAPDGAVVAATTGAGEVWLVDAATGALLGEPLAPGAGELLSVAFSSDGSTVLAGSGRGQVHAWSLPSRQPRFAPVDAHTSDIWELVTLPPEPTAAGEGTFLTVSSDGTARLWSLDTGAPARGGPFDDDASGVPSGVRGVTVDPADGVVTLGGADGALYSWSVAERRIVLRNGPVHRARVIAAARSADGLSLVSLSDDRTLQVWSGRPRPHPVRRVAGLDARPASMAVAPDGSALALGTAGGTVRLLDAVTGVERSRFDGHAGDVTSVAFAGDDRLVTGDSAGTLRVWDLGTGRVAGERERAHDGAITALAVAGGRVVSGGADRNVRRWDPSGLQSRGPALGPLPAPVTSLAASSDGDTIAGSTEGGQVLRWTGAGRSIGDPVEVTDDAVWGVALVDGGDVIAVAGGDETLTLWSEGRDRLPRRAHELGAHTAGALAVAQAGTGAVAVSTGDGHVHLWDATSGASLGPALAVAGSAIRHLAGAADGAIWAAADDGAVVRIDVLVVDAACAEAGASFDARQRVRLLAGRPPVACRRMPS